MASLWRHVYFKQILLKEIEENFSDKDVDEVLKNAYTDLHLLVKRLTNEEEISAKEERECDNFLNAFDVFVLIMKFAQSNCNQIDNKFKLKLTDKLIDCVVKPSRYIFLSGEWMLLDTQRKEDLMALMKEMRDQIPLKKAEITGMIDSAENPWSSQAIVNLINGKTEKEEEVLGLLSSEGVEGVALRIEMMVESGMDNEALKAVLAVVIALISEDMILQSYVSTSAPSIVDRLVDIFLVLSAKLKKDLRLLKVLKLIGLKDVNQICIPRLNKYMPESLSHSDDNKSKQEKVDSEKAKSEKVSDEKVKIGKVDDNDKGTDEKVKDGENDEDSDVEIAEEENEDQDLEDRFKLLEKGRCGNLFTEENCLKALEIILQWSLASVAVQDTDYKLQQQLINGWMDRCMHNRTKFNEDMEVLLECTTHSSFLYTLAHAWHHRLGKEVEIRCLQIFVRALTRDINEYEAVKRIKSSKNAMEEKLARAFWFLGDIVYDRTSLSREAVLTGFSIKPDQQALDRIIELAKSSGVDQTQADSDTEVDTKTEVDEMDTSKTGLHCRVTVGEGGEKKKFLKSYHQARKLKDNTAPIDSVLVSFNDSQTLDNLPFQDFESELKEKSFSMAATKLRTNKPREKRTRNLEGLISIRGELVTEAANYNPLDKPCKSLDSGVLNLPSTLTDDLLIVISAPRWHMLTWVMAWPDLLKACNNLLKNPKLREPTEDLKYLNIDYTQFNGWSSDEEVTIYTGIEKGYEQWVLEGPDDNNDDKEVSESEASSDEEKIDHNINWEDYDDVDKYIVPEDYDPESVRSKQMIENFKISDETNTESDENDDDDEKSNAKKGASEEKDVSEKPSSSKKRKLENKDKISENVQDEFCNE